jgi:putative ABC transport system permease protein
VNIANVQSGYGMSRILTMSVTAVEGNWNDYHRRALERVAAIPGVQYAAFAWGVPLTGNDWPVSLDIEGQPPPMKASDRFSIPLRAATEDYFKILGLPVIEGRGFRATDTNDAPGVAVVNQAFVDRFFPHQQAIGKKFWFDSRDKPGIQFVGVIANGRTDDLTKSSGPEIYMPLWQAHAFSKHLVVRTASDPHTVMAAVRRELHAVNPTVAVENLKTLEDIRSDSLASRTFALQLLAGFAVVGSLLTLVGIHGVLSLTVASRRRELAIRSAVGAQQRDIRNLIFAEGFRLIAAGVVAGIAAALVLARFLGSFLFEVRPGDPLTLVGVALLFIAVAMLACWAPTRRAGRVDPIEALRCD